MSTYVQADRPLTVTTPLGPDALLLRGLVGQEAISRLFDFQLDLIAENGTDVPFDKLLGQKVAVELGLPSRKTRYFHGICSRLSQGVRDATFTYYRMEVVPQFWFLTRRAQSRIFQHLSVPDILKKVLAGLDVAYELKASYFARDYCVQYRETDFQFASRLMEEEGIYYFFKHSADGHKLVVADSAQSHPDLPESSRVTFERSEVGDREADRITAWEKIQELRSGKVTLWDHNFELPHKHLEADKLIQDEAAVGAVTHKMKIGRNDKLELYDYPGEYAQRFDGVDPAGGDRAGDLNHITEDNQRTVAVRMQEEAAAGLTIRGSGHCRYLVSGHKFTLVDHFDGDGPYILTAVQHQATLAGDYRSDMGGEFSYANSFTCIPASIPFRPRRETPRPVVQGTQTAVVVGPAGEEIFTDKYSRVKVQFHWDREGQNNADSSCWVRVGTIWAGTQWGAIHVPRIGQEVIVAFEEGNPDRPIVVGSVYNADTMPPYALPANKTQSGIKSRSSLGGSPANYNEIRFEDKKGSEQVLIHAEKDQSIEVEHDESHWVGHDRAKTIDHDETTHVKHDRTETVDHNETITIGVNRTEKVGKDESITIGANRTESVGKNESITIGANRTENVGKDESITIGSNRTENVGKNESITIGANRSETVGKDESITIGANRTESVGKAETVSVADDRSHSVGKNDNLSVGKALVVTAGDSITLTTGSASIVMQKNGDITIQGKDITIVGSGEIAGKASKNMTLKAQKILQN